MYSEKMKKNEENKFLEIYLSIIENEKKKNSAETIFGLLPKLYCEKKNCIPMMELYCNRGGLAARRLENFIAIQLLYCDQECIAAGWWLGTNCIAIHSSVL